MMQKVDFNLAVEILGVVEGKPFEAEFEQIVSKKMGSNQTTQTKLKGKLYRDSSGRRRKEMRLEIGPGITLNVAYIHDFVAKKIHILDLNQRTAKTIDLPDGSLNEKLSALEEQGDIGKIEGFICIIYRMSLSGKTIEYWIAKDLIEILLVKTSSPNEEVIIRTFNIQLKEPRQDLFAVPSDYK